MIIYIRVLVPLKASRLNCLEFMLLYCAAFVHYVAVMHNVVEKKIMSYCDVTLVSEDFETVILHITNICIHSFIF